MSKYNQLKYDDLIGRLEMKLALVEKAEARLAACEFPPHQSRIEQEISEMLGDIQDLERALLPAAIEEHGGHVDAEALHEELTLAGASIELDQVAQALEAYHQQQAWQEAQEEDETLASLRRELGPLRHGQ